MRSSNEAGSCLGPEDFGVPEVRCSETALCLMLAEDAGLKWKALGTTHLEPFCFTERPSIHRWSRVLAPVEAHDISATEAPQRGALECDDTLQRLDAAMSPPGGLSFSTLQQPLRGTPMLGGDGDGRWGGIFWGWFSEEGLGTGGVAGNFEIGRKLLGENGTVDHCLGKPMTYTWWTWSPWWLPHFIHAWSSQHHQPAQDQGGEPVVPLCRRSGRGCGAERIWPSTLLVDPGRKLQGKPQS